MTSRGPRRVEAGTPRRPGGPLRPGRTTRRGGPGAIAGFLYQFLAAVDWAASAWLDVGDLADGEAGTATLVLEPAEGGDARYEAGAAPTRVVQYKLRGRSGLSARDLCRSVLPDLWRAAGAREAAFELQTNRPLGASGRALVAAFERLCVGEPPSRPAEALPDGPATLRIGSGRFSPRGAFLEALAGCLGLDEGVPPPTGDSEGQHRLWRLLARFGVPEPVAADELARQVDAFLRAVIPYPEEAAAKRGALVAALINRAGRGGARLTADELFGIIDVAREQAEARLTAPRRLAEVLRGALRERGYEAAGDVRAGVETPGGEDVAVFAGESGAGKSWRLCRLAHDLGRAGEAVVLCRARTLEDLGRQVVGLVWHGALRQTRPLDLEPLPSRWREMTGRLRTRRLWIAWEGAESAGEIERALGLGLTRHGFGLAVEAPPPAPSWLLERAGVEPRPVGRFSVKELLAFLERRKLDPAEIPADVLEPLRLPVLASLYAEVARDAPGWRPTSEYEVVGRFWGRLLDGRVHHDHPGDANGVRKLAGRFVEEGGGYPFGGDDLAAAGLADGAVGRLERSGWLGRDGPGRWRFGHDRLLNWAAAEHLVGRWAANEVDAAGLASAVGRLGEGAAPRGEFRPPRLGYLLMDVVWLAAGRPGIGPARLAGLLRALEAEVEHGVPEEFYRRLLPTAGVAVLPAVEARAGAEPEEGPAYMPAMFAGALLGIAHLDRAAVAEAAARLWRSPGRAARATALEVAAGMPVPALREDLWRELADRAAALGDAGRADHDAYELASAAVHELVRTDVGWLEGKARSETGEHELAGCAWLLARLEPPPAALWLDVKGRLFGLLPPGQARCLAACVRRFGDRAELARLEGWARDEGFVALTAWQAMCDLAPDRALAVLHDVASTVLGMTRQAWLPALLGHDGATTRSLLRRELLARDPRGAELARAWGEQPDGMDAATVEVLLDRLDEALAEEPGPDGFRGGGHLLRLLSDGRLSPEHHGLFAARRGSRLDDRLARLVHGLLARRAGLDVGWDYGPARLLLARIGGRSDEELVVACLDHANHRVRVEGARDAVRVATPDVLARLWPLADALGHDDKDVVWVAVNAWRTLFIVDAGAARTKALALLGSTEEGDRRRGFWLAGESGDEALRPAVEAALGVSAPGSPAETSALKAALDLEAGSTEMAGRALRLLAADPGGDAYPVALEVLLAAGTEEAKQALDGHLVEVLGKPSRPMAAIQAFVARCRQPDPSPAMLDRLERLAPAEFWFSPGLLFALAAHPGERAREILSEAAFADSGPGERSCRLRSRPSPGSTARSPGGPSRAPGGCTHGRERLAPIAVRLGPAAVAAVAGGLAREEDEATLRAAHVALRRAGPAALDALAGLARSGRRADREAAAEALGWVPGGEEALRGLADDADPDVRSAARGGLLRRARERSALARLAGAGPADRFGLVDHLLSLLEPEVAGDRSDPATVAPPLEGSPALAAFAERRLDERLREAGRPRLARRRRRGG